MGEIFFPAGLHVTFSPQFHASCAPNKSSIAIVFENLNLPENLVLFLQQFAGCEKSTFFSILLTTFTALLHRYTWHDDIVLGCPVANGNRTRAEPLIGVFINTLPFRARFVPKDTLRRVSESVIRLQHLEVSFQFLVQDTTRWSEPRLPIGRPITNT